MKPKHLILLFIFLPFAFCIKAQDTLRFSGQFSSWLNLNSAGGLPLWGGVRYIPQLNAETTFNSGALFDAEASVNLYGNAGTDPFSAWETSGDIKPYRAWVRYSTDQLELRLGLQKLNFGSASMLRPLMWFDQLDPRDPLQLTDGVWGLLGRYYFMNNANIWLWGLYGNNERRGWEAVPVNRNIPEFGGRIQVPVPAGEAAFTYHHRVADSRNMGEFVNGFDKIGENKFGLDARWDLAAGIWFEGSLTHKNRNLGMLTSQTALNIGADYTFPAGNGLYVAFEQLFAGYSEKIFAPGNQMSFSMISAGYPLGLFDRLSSILYYNWSDNNIYTFLNWQRQFDKIMFYLMVYWNPDTFQLPARTSSMNIFGGKGIQLMFVFNH
jgi:hypothetical protein